MGSKQSATVTDEAKVPNKSVESGLDMANFSSKEKLESRAEDYDPFAARNPENPNSDYGAMAHLLKSSLGSGILAMPSAIKNSGLVFGTIATIIVGVICTYSVHLLVYCSHVLCRRVKVPCLTFAETAQKAVETGPPAIRHHSNFAKNFVDILLLLTYYSMMCVYVVFIALSVQQVCIYYYPETANFDIRYYILAFAPALIAMGQIRSLKFLVPFSTMANALISISFGITLYYMFREIPSPSERNNFVSVDKLPHFFSTVIFAVEGIGVVLPVENSMKKPTHFLGCPGVLNIAMGIVVALYTVIGFFGYLKFGEETESSITLNLPTDEPLAQVVKLLMAIATIFTYGLQFYVPTEIVVRFLDKRVAASWKQVAETSFRVSAVLVTVLVSIAVPNLQPIIGLVGSLFASTLGLLVPALIDSFTHYDSASWLHHGRNVFIGLFSIFALLIGSYTSILDIIHTYT